MSREPTPDGPDLFGIIPPNLAVKAMRDSGYKNTAYALAELIDNSVQAGADTVEVICLEEARMIRERTSNRISAVGVLDNGGGMTPGILRRALQFGNGTHLNDRKGIGRFGMGLPNSSISQCRRVEVYTWQSGPDNAMYTYLDVDAIENGDLSMVPEPEHRTIPAEWLERSDNLETTGTLVLWTDFDEHRLSWRGARAVLRHTEVRVGRMYRKFINDGELSIRLLAFHQDEAGPTFDEFARVNDPLYLMRNSSTPPPFDEEPMFEPWGSGNDREIPVTYNGSTHKVVVRASLARYETVERIGGSGDRGHTKYGKRAAENIGVSIVREGRELDLDKAWASSYDPTDRWWGVEVSFPSALDEVFGVTNNKQSAANFSRMAQFSLEKEAGMSGVSEKEFLEHVEEEGDLRLLLAYTAHYVQEQIKLMRLQVKKQTAGRRKRQRHDQPSTADLATAKFRERAKDRPTEADSRELTEESRKEFERDLEHDKHYPKPLAKQIADEAFARKHKVVFLTKRMDSYAFFSVENHHGGLTPIVFNSSHPFYERLLESLDPQELGDETDADLMARIHRAADTLKLLFAAWARYEMEEMQRRIQMPDMRQEWGKMARFFLTEEDDE